MCKGLGVERSLMCLKKREKILVAGEQHNLPISPGDLEHLGDVEKEAQRGIEICPRLHSWYWKNQGLSDSRACVLNEGTRPLPRGSTGPQEGSPTWITSV